MQLALAWAHENPIRRQYYDSGAQEGIGFYAEEMMLQAGLWAESPRSREIIYNFARLRALRVEVDVRLATGTFTIAQAADYLEKTVPMDRETALEEAASFAAGPGSGDHLPDRQAADHADAGRRPSRSGRRLLAARLPRHGLEERQRARCRCCAGSWSATGAKWTAWRRFADRRIAGPGDPSPHDHDAGTSAGWCDEARYTMSIECPYCALRDPEQRVVFRDELVLYLEDVRFQGALAHSGAIVPVQHRPTVFDLSEAEITATFRMLARVKGWMDAEFAPDGYNIGWNCGEVGGQSLFHAHMHVIPRFRHEPLAGQGIRSYLKSDANRRP